jgi:TPR repeat protein
MRYKSIAPCAVLALTGAAFAQPFDGLTRQQREWRFQEEIWDTMKATSDATRRFDENIRGWQGAGENIRRFFEEKEAARQRAREANRQASITAERQRKEEAARRIENERARAEAEARRVRNYRTFLERGGHGTRETPPHFYDEAQAFQWYLKQAEAGDPHAAFFVGRFYHRRGKETESAQWLAKSNLSNPKAAALYGSLLLRGAGVARDEARGRPMLEKAAAADASGYAAWLYSTLLRDGNGVTADVVKSALHLGQAIVMAEQPSMLEGLDPLAPWDERMWERLNRRWRMRDELKALAAQQPELYVAAMEAASVQKSSDVYGVLGGAVGEMEPEPARTVYLAWLKLTESRPTPWGYWGRASAIGGLVSKRHPDAAAHSLLPDTFNRTAKSFIPHSDEQASKLWEAHAATIEEWSRGSNELAPRAARALVAREMGRWPKVSSRQPARTVLAKLRALKVANPRDVLAGEVLDGVFTGNPTWSDKTKAVQWLDELGTLDAGFKDLRELYLKAPALEDRFAHTLDPIVLALRNAQGGRQAFTPAQLDAAEAERNAAARLLFSDPQAAFDGLLKALQGGDALAGWQLLIMAEGKFRSILKQQPSLLELTHERLQRDAKGSDDRAATAALALHFLHQPAAVGRQWQRGWRVTPPSSVNWLQLAEQKGHPWAVFHSAGGYDAANKARNRNDPEAQKIWPWLAQNYDALSKTELWRRDAQLLELFPVDREIEFLQPALRAVEWARSEAVSFADTVARLESAREILAAYDQAPDALDEVQAKALYEGSLRLAQLDSDAGVLLPRHRVQCLELLVQSAILGDESAPLEAGALLKAPGFPFEPQPAEAQHWLEVGQARLRKIAEKGAPGAAMDAAYLLAMEFKSGQTFARDHAQARKYFALAATLGHRRAASTLGNAYRFGEMGLTQDASEQQRWQDLAEAIAMGRYKIPSAALAGRPKDPPRQ